MFGHTFESIRVGNSYTRMASRRVRSNRVAMLAHAHCVRVATSEP